MAHDITVLTSIVGDRDNQLRDDQNTAGARFVAFVDRVLPSAVWELAPAYARFKSDRRNSRAPKIIPHQFVDSKYSIWIDATMALRVPAAEVIADWLGDNDIAVFAHEARQCTYAEAEVCMSRRLDDPAVVEKQIGKYQREKLGRELGLARCSMIVRRHNRRVEMFNNSWWSEHCAFSVRDQLGFVYATRHADVKVNLVREDVYSNRYFDFHSRTAGAEPPENNGHPAWPRGDATGAALESSHRHSLSLIRPSSTNAPEIVEVAAADSAQPRPV